MLLTILGVALVFVMRIVDVSLQTIRIVVLMRGHIRLAALLGFFESLTWVIAASLVFANLGNPVRAVAFAAGFAAGVLMGGWLEKRIAMGNSFVRIVAPVTAPPVAPALRDADFPVTVINAEGRDGEVRISFLVVKRRSLPEALALIREANAEAFVTVEEVNLPDLERLRRGVAVRK